MTAVCGEGKSVDALFMAALGVATQAGAQLVSQGESVRHQRSGKASEKFYAAFLHLGQLNGKNQET